MKFTILKRRLNTLIVVLILLTVSGTLFGQTKQFKLRKFLNLEGEVHVSVVYTKDPGTTGFSMGSLDKKGINVSAKKDEVEGVQVITFLETDETRKYFVEVPPLTSLKIDYDKVCVNPLFISGDFEMLEINNSTSPIELKELEGSVIVNSKSDVEASFLKVEDNSPISIVTADDGNISIYLPSDASIDIVARTMTGSIFTNFEKIKEKAGGNGLWKREFRGSLNGARTKVFLQTSNGNISIFKKSLL